MAGEQDHERERPRRDPPLVPSLRAGALTAGLSALAFGVSLAGGNELGASSDSKIEAWCALTLVALFVALRVGYPHPAHGPLALLGRIAGTVFCGGSIIAAGVGALITKYAAPEGDPSAWGALFVAGGALVLLSRVRMPDAPPDDEALPDDGPGGLLPAAPAEDRGATFALVASGPPLPADEYERDAPSIEVRVLWGADLLCVRHLTPPRSFSIGQGARVDFPLPGEALGADVLPLVLVDQTGARVIAPRGATGSVEELATGRREPLSSAAKPWSELASATHVRLDPGARVTVAIPLSAGSQGYRALPAADAGEARVIFEIARVRAGRAVGKRPSLAGRGGIIAAMALSALAASAALTVASRWAHVEPDDDDLPSGEDRLEIYRVMQKLDEQREDEKEATREEQLAAIRALPLPQLRYGPYLWQDEREPPADLESAPFDAPLPVLSGFCFVPYWPEEMSSPSWLFDRPRTICEMRTLTPFGIRDLSAPRPPRLDAGNAPDDLFEHSYADAARRIRRGELRPSLGQPIVARATIGQRPGVTMRFLPLPSQGIDRDADRAKALFHRRSRAIRSCHELGLLLDPERRGSLDLLVVVGADGRAVTWITRQDSVDPIVVSCIRDAFASLRVLPPPAQVETLRYALTFGPRR